MFLLLVIQLHQFKSVPCTSSSDASSAATTGTLQRSASSSAWGGHRSANGTPLGLSCNQTVLWFPGPWPRATLFSRNHCTDEKIEGGRESGLLAKCWRRQISRSTLYIIDIVLEWWGKHSRISTLILEQSKQSLSLTKVEWLILRCKYLQIMTLLSISAYSKYSDYRESQEKWRLCLLLWALNHRLFSAFLLLRGAFWRFSDFFPSGPYLHVVVSNARD